MERMSEGWFRVLAWSIDSQCISQLPRWWVWYRSMLPVPTLDGNSMLFLIAAKPEALAITSSGRCVAVVLKSNFLCDKLAHTTSLLDLALGVLAEETCADDDWDLRDATLAENLAVAEGKEIEDGCGVTGLASNVLLALLKRDERPELYVVRRSSFYSCHYFLTFSRLMTGFQKWFCCL